MHLTLKSLLIVIVMLSFALNGVSQNSNTNDVMQKKSIIEELKKLNDKPIEERIALFYSLKQKEPTLYDFDNEDQLNLYGYNLLWNGKAADAIQIFKLVVDEFPKSANAYDSLGEAYMANRDTANAIINYEKTLLMDGDNYNAEDQLFLLSNSGSKLESPKEKYNKTYKVIEYQEDLDQLGKDLETIHPNVFKFITKDLFWAAIEESKSKITDQTTYQEFLWYCNEIISNVNCSHTGLTRFYHENEIIPPSIQFPIQVRLINEKLCVTNTWDNENNTSVKDEILSINGVKVADIISDIYKRIPSQGFVMTTKNHVFNTWAHTLIAFSLGFPQSYTISVEGIEGTILLNKNTSHRRANFEPAIPHCGDDLCLQFFDGDENAILTISSFNYYYWNNYKVFEEFIDKGFSEIANRGVKNLIIDLRYNGGGSPESSIHLLQYLISKPFTYYSIADYPNKEEKHEGEGEFAPFENRFKGKCYFLIDGQGNSTTGHFMSLVKEHKLGIVIGEELGSNQFCSAGQKRRRLSNTKVTFDVANNTHKTTALSLPDERGILPDYSINQTIEDFIDKKDVVKEYALQLIGSSSGVREIIAKNNLIATPDFTWGKELIKFPIHFAKEINYSGIEELQFPKGWSDEESDDYWSYVFVWKIDGDKKISSEQLVTDLQYYFDGLMKVNNRTPDDRFSKTKVFLRESKDGYIGEVQTIDNFFTKQSMTLYVTIEQSLCKKTGQNNILFRLSPKNMEHSIWGKLNMLSLQPDFCRQ